MIELRVILGWYEAHSTEEPIQNKAHPPVLYKWNQVKIKINVKTQSKVSQKFWDEHWIQLRGGCQKAERGPPCFGHTGGCVICVGRACVTSPCCSGSTQLWQLVPPFPESWGSFRVTQVGVPLSKSRRQGDRGLFVKQWGPDKPVKVEDSWELVAGGRGWKVCWGTG